MDMLYHRYACPMDLVNSYINRGRFGEFVTSFLEAEYQRKKEEAEKDEDWKLWMMYIHTYSEESFRDWKKRVVKSSNQPKKGTDEDLTGEGIQAIIDDLFSGDNETG